MKNYFMRDDKIFSVEDEEMLKVICRCEGGITLLQFNEGVGFIDSNNELLAKEKFKKAEPFFRGFAIVTRESDVVNFLKTDGTFLSEEDFIYAGLFRDGYAVVANKDKLYNYIGTDGKILLDEWVEWCNDFSFGFGRIKKDGLLNFVNNTGLPISKEWFECAYDFECNGAARVEGKDQTFNYINTDGSLRYNWKYK